MSLQALTSLSTSAVSLPQCSPSPQDTALTSKKRARSSAGCSNCKTRKVKCDERRPGCSRCHTQGLTCPGYPTNVFRWSSKHEVRDAQASQNATKRHASIDSQIPLEEAFERASKTVVLNKAVPSPTSWSTSSAQLATWPTQFTIEPDTISPSELFSNSNALLEEDSLPDALEQVIDIGATHREPEALMEGILTIRNSSNNPRNHAIRTNRQHDPAQYGSAYAGSSTISSAFDFNPSEADHTFSSPPTALLHIPTVLVEYYFQKVCRECSTFDSTFNPFRTMVSEMRNRSASMNHAIQSLAASKLADDMPRMRVVGIEAQGQALNCLKEECYAVTALQDVSNEVLCTILLLGMTASWHLREDLGLGYFQLARRIVSAKVQAPNHKATADLDFYKNALKYWTMIISIVSGDVQCDEPYENQQVSNTVPSPVSPFPEKIMPHPWTGVSPVSQELFGRVLQLVRRTRAECGAKRNADYSRARIAHMLKAISAAEQLEAQCWAVSIPSVDDLQDTGDPSTPRIHHVLTAKAYLLSALLHIYMVFPDVLESATQSFVGSGPAVSALPEELLSCSSAHVVTKNHLWAKRAIGDAHDMWIRDISLAIVECLGQINVKSSTRSVHPPLLLSVASALTLPRASKCVKEQCVDHGAGCSESAEMQDNMFDLQSQTITELSFRVRQSRSFIIDRLETMHAIMRFHAIENILQVINEVWRRADAGSDDIFWMDIMYTLHCESIFG